MLAVKDLATGAVGVAAACDALSSRAVGEQAAILAGEGDTLSHTLIDDLSADLGQAMHVGFARAEIPALDRVIKEPIDAVAVVLIVLRRIDAALCRDAVSSPGATTVERFRASMSVRVEPVSP